MNNILNTGFSVASWSSRVRVRAIGPNNTRSGWSDPATILVN